MPKNDQTVPGGLLGSRDRQSGQAVFPRIPDRSPSASRFESIVLSSRATLYSFSIIHPNPKTGEKPYVVVYADFPEGARVFGRLVRTPTMRPKIGMSLQTRIEGDRYYFIPFEESAND